MRPGVGVIPSATRGAVAGAILIDCRYRSRPVSCCHSLRYLDEDLFGGGRFHRTVTLHNLPVIRSWGK